MVSRATLSAKRLAIPGMSAVPALRLWGMNESRVETKATVFVSEKGEDSAISMSNVGHGIPKIHFLWFQRM